MREPLINSVAGTKDHIQPKNIKTFKTVVVPGKLPNSAEVIIIGLGGDNKMYQWSAKDGKWRIVN